MWLVDSLILELEVGITRSGITRCCFRHGNIRGKIDHVWCNSHSMPRLTGEAWNVYCTVANKNWLCSGGTCLYLS